MGLFSVCQPGQCTCSVAWVASSSPALCSGGYNTLRRPGCCPLLSAPASLSQLLIGLVLLLTARLHEQWPLWVLWSVRGPPHCGLQAPLWSGALTCLHSCQAQLVSGLMRSLSSACVPVVLYSTFSSPSPSYFFPPFFMSLFLRLGRAGSSYVAASAIHLETRVSVFLFPSPRPSLGSKAFRHSCQPCLHSTSILTL